MQFKEDYKKIKKNYRSLSFGERFIIWTRFKMTPLKELLEFIPARGWLLDLGCGFGNFSYFLAWRYPDLTILGLDPSEARIKSAQNVFLMPSNLSFMRGKIDNLTEGNFDVILLIDVIFSLSKKELEKMLRNCYGKTKQGGIMIIKTMNKERFFQHLISSIISFFLAKIFLFLGYFLKNDSIKKITGTRNTVPSQYYPYSSNELQDLLRKNDWEVEVRDAKSGFLIYPNIIYFCKK